MIEHKKTFKKAFALVLAAALFFTSAGVEDFVSYAADTEGITCEHSTTTIVSNENGRHKVECVDCAEVVEENECTDEDSDGRCDLCGYEFPTPECQHESTSTVSIGGLKHNAICNGCGEVVAEAEDCTDDDGNGVCDLCEYEYPAPLPNEPVSSGEPEQAPCAHENVSYESCGDYTHRAVCSDCMEYADEEAEDCFDDDEDGCCDACDFSETVSHEGISTYDSSEPNTCPVCGEPRATYYNSLVGGDAGVQTHASKCINGHVWGEDYCKFVNTTYSYAGKSGDKMRHMVICDVCGQNAYEKCTTFRIEDGKTYLYYPLSGSNSYCLTKHVVKCVYCSGHGGGTLTDFPNETEDMIRLGYIPSYDHTPTVTCNNDGTHSYTCDECGLNISKECTNADGKKMTESGAWTDNGDGTHTFTCSACGYSVTEDHAYGNCKKNEPQTDEQKFYYSGNYFSSYWAEERIGEATHSKTCSKCSSVHTEACTFGSWTPVYDENELHTAQCSVCYNTARGIHDELGSVVSLGETGHSIECSICGNTHNEEHQNSVTETYLQKDTESSSYPKASYHIHKTITECSVCDYVNSLEKNELHNWDTPTLDYENNSFSRTCLDCGYIDEQTVYHVYVNNNGGVGGVSDLYAIGNNVYTDIVNMTELTSLKMPIPTNGTRRFYGYYNTLNNDSYNLSCIIDNSGGINASVIEAYNGWTVYAHWSPIQITLDYDGGTGNYSVTKVFMSESYDLSEDIRDSYLYSNSYPNLWSMPVKGNSVNASKGAFIIDGFYTQPNGGGDKIIDVPLSRSSYITLTDKGKEISESTTVYAHYTLDPSRYVKFTIDMNGVEPSNADDLITTFYVDTTLNDRFFLSVDDVLANTNSLTSIPVPVANGYTFAGCNASTSPYSSKYFNEEGIWQNYLTSYTSNETIYAIWNTDRIKIKYLTADKNDTLGEVVYDYGSEVSYKPDCNHDKVHSNYTKIDKFVGFGLYKDGEVIVPESSSISLPFSKAERITNATDKSETVYNEMISNKLVTYVPLYEEKTIPYKFVWYIDEGTEWDTETGSYNECCDYRPAVPTKAGYTFSGWSQKTNKYDAYADWMNRGEDYSNDFAEIAFEAIWLSVQDINVSFYNNPVNSGSLIARGYYSYGDEVQIPALSSYAANNASCSNFAKADYYSNDNFDYTKDYPIYKMELYEWQLIDFDPALIASKGPQDDKLWGSGTPTSVLPLSALTGESYADVADAYANMLTNKEINYRAYFKRNGETKVNVKYVDYDGSLIQESGAMDFSDVIDNDWYEPVDKPVREGYTFWGWVKETDMATARETWRSNGSDFSKPLEVVYKAAYTMKVFTITFIDFDGNPTTEQVAYGGNAYAPALDWAEKDGIDYRFDGWDKDIVNPVYSDAVYTSKWTPWYLVKFVDYHDKTLKSAKVKKDAMPKAPSVPSFEEDGYTFTFKSWEPEIAKSTEPAVYKAVYEKTAIAYTVKFVDYNGNVLKEAEMKKGDTPEAPSVPSFKDDTYEYTFKAWSPAVVKVSGDATYKATYTKRRIKEEVAPTPKPEPAEEEPNDEPDNEPEEPVVEREEPEPIPVPDEVVAEEEPVSEPEEPEREAEPEENPVIEDVPTVEEPEPSIPQPSVEEPEEETWVPTEEPADENPKVNRTVVTALATGAIAVALVATGVLDYIWMIALMFLFKRRKKFHGVLTMDDNRFVKLSVSDNDYETVQEAIDKSGSFEDFVENILGKSSVTYLPYNSKMSFSYRGSNGDVEVITMDADEMGMYKELEALKGVGPVEVHIYNTRAKFDIPLHFKMQ